MENYSASIPSRNDFVDYEDDLDQLHAWEAFGGTTIDEAYCRFKDDPLNNLSAMMYVSSVAFRYYIEAALKYMSEPDSKGYEEFLLNLVSVLDSWTFREESRAAIKDCLPRIKFALEFLIERGDYDECYGGKGKGKKRLQEIIERLSGL